MSRYRLFWPATGKVVHFSSSRHKGMSGRNSLQAYYDKRYGQGHIIVTLIVPQNQNANHTPSILETYAVYNSVGIFMGYYTLEEVEALLEKNQDWTFSKV